MNKIEEEIKMRLEMIEDLQGMLKVHDLPLSVRLAVPESIKSHQDIIDRLQAENE